MAAVTNRIHRRIVFGLLILLLAGFGIAALSPFRPRTLQHNRAVVLQGQGLRFPAPGLVATTRSPQWLQRAIEDNSLEIALLVRSFSPQQFGPARIFTISQDTYHRDLTIAQDGADLVVRLRTPATDANGIPPYRIDDVFQEQAERNVTVSIAPNKLCILVDDAPVLRRSIPPSSLSSWNRDYRMAFGNELTGDRPWLGAVRDATVRVGEKRVDLTTGDEFNSPAYYFPGFELNAFPAPSLVDCLLNFLCFLPVGLVLALLFHHHRPVLWATLLCALLSLAVECTQVFVATRHPSALDFLLNTSGAFVGAMALRYRDRLNLWTVVPSQDTGGQDQTALP